eukprot:2973462-Rhodomonas_salina.2
MLLAGKGQAGKAFPGREIRRDAPRRGGLAGTIPFSSLRTRYANPTSLRAHYAMSETDQCCLLPGSARHRLVLCLRWQPHSVVTSDKRRRKFVATKSAEAISCNALLVLNSEPRRAKCSCCGHVSDEVVTSQMRLSRLGWCGHVTAPAGPGRG